jgi:hypothetical protein
MIEPFSRKDCSTKLFLGDPTIVKNAASFTECAEALTKYILLVVQGFLPSLN